MVQFAGAERTWYLRDCVQLLSSQESSCPGFTKRILKYLLSNVQCVDCVGDARKDSHGQECLSLVAGMYELFSDDEQDCVWRHSFSHVICCLSIYFSEPSSV